MTVPKINIDVTAPYINGRTVGQDIHNRLTAYKALEAGTLPKKPHVLANQTAEMARVVDTFNKQNGTNLPLPEVKEAGAGVKSVFDSAIKAAKKHPAVTTVVVAIPLAIAAAVGIKKAVDAKKAEPVQK
ncbi:MAG: hypothetical protein IKL52_03260 [Candidatus Gastranaerophilales bacterium]|nr:hypothetical protein [Candidatus Gastranaerophilales bacterium]